MSRSSYRILSLLLLVLLLVACAGNPQLAPLDSNALAWPAAPAPSRVVFRQSFSRAEELGISKGFLRWLREVLVGGEETRLIRPMAVVMTPDRRIYVADPGAHGVHLFDLQENQYQLLRLKNEQPLLSPVGLCLGPDGMVFITDSKLGAIYRHRRGQAFVQPLELEEPLAQPTGITWDPIENRFYVVDTVRHHVRVVDARGETLKTIGSRGSAPGEFNFPTYAWMSVDGILAITDTLNFRIQLLDRAGNPITAFGSPGDASGNLSRPKGVSMDRDGNIYVVDTLFHAIQVFDAQGRLLLAMGQQGQGEGEFWLPTGVFVTQEGDIFVADSHNQRIQILHYLGEQL